MMFALGLLVTARRALASVAGFAKANPLAALLALSVALTAWFWHGKQNETRRADKWHAAWTAMDTAQKAATAYAKADAARKDALANDIKDDANDSRKVAQAAGARAGNDYATRNRCVRITPASSGVNADLSGADSVAGQPAPEASAVDLVGVTRPDFNACTVNTLDLANAVQWADDMRVKGLAK